jgi:hypothetical protein
MCGGAVVLDTSGVGLDAQGWSGNEGPNERAGRRGTGHRRAPKRSFGRIGPRVGPGTGGLRYEPTVDPGRPGDHTENTRKSQVPLEPTGSVDGQ